MTEALVHPDWVRRLNLFGDVVGDPRLLATLDPAELLATDWQGYAEQMRDVLKQKCYDEGLIIIGCGDRSVRFRPALNISRDELDLGIKVIREQLKELSVRDY